MKDMGIIVIILELMINVIGFRSILTGSYAYAIREW